jgi:ATP-dependent RNA helicase DDX24/MAK5
LAYGLPIIHHLLSQLQGEVTTLTDGKRRRVLRALILTPTRELALQVESHLKDCVASIQPGSVVISIAAVVGGIAPPKQRRILDRGVDILVATPGRLWDIMVEVRYTYYELCYQKKRNEKKRTNKYFSCLRNLFRAS